MTVVAEDDDEDEVTPATPLLLADRWLLSIGEEARRPLAVIALAGVVWASSFFLKTETSRSNLHQLIEIDRS